MARKHINRSNPSRWTREARKAKKRAGVLQAASPVVVEEVKETEVKVEEVEAKVEESPAVAAVAKKSAPRRASGKSSTRRRRRVSKSNQEE